MINKITLKKLFVLVLILVVSFTTCSRASSVDINTPCIVIHAGEYPGKAKQSFIANEITNLNTQLYPTKNNGTVLEEFYLNKVICQKVAKYIRAGDSRITVIEFYSEDRSTDLNAAGRKALTYNPDLYLSIHHNCTQAKHGEARGFICMTARGNYSSQSEKVAQNIAKSMKSVSKETGLPQFIGFSDGNWKNNTYVGEMNETNRKCPTVLVEVGFFNNLEDLNIVTNAKKNDIIAKAIAVAILKDFHAGKFDNDQSGETKQDTTMKGAEKVTLTAPKKQIEVNDDTNKNIKPERVVELTRLQWLKQKIFGSKNDRRSLKSISRTGPRTDAGRNKIKSMKK